VTEERRRYIRVPVTLSIRFQAMEDFSEFIQANVCNLSRGGLFIRTAVSKPVGSMVLIQIPDGAGDFHTIKGIVQCVISPEGGATHLEPGIGIEFVAVDAALAQVIEAVIARSRPDE